LALRRKAEASYKFRGEVEGAAMRFVKVSDRKIG